MSRAVHSRDAAAQLDLKRRQPRPVTTVDHSTSASASAAAPVQKEQHGTPVAHADATAPQPSPTGVVGNGAVFTTSFVDPDANDDPRVASLLGAKRSRPLGGPTSSSSSSSEESSSDDDDGEDERLRLELEALKKARAAKLQAAAKAQEDVATRAAARYDADVLFHYDVKPQSGISRSASAGAAGAGTATAWQVTVPNALDKSAQQELREQLTNDMTQSAFHRRFLKRFFR